MDQRSQQMRSAAPVTAALLGFVVALCGCQNNVQSDLIARELRLQEDKIYAQQDCLEQYQQLIRQYRAENNALKRKLAQEQSNEAPRATAPSRDESAPTFGQPTPNETPTIPSDPPTRTTQPDDLIPPLMPTTPPAGQTIRPTNHTSSLDMRPPAVSPDRQRIVHVAAYAAAVEKPAETSARAGEIATADRVWLTGEIVANENGGPRLLVDVTPLTSAGRPAAYQGELSLMVLTNAESTAPKNLARWDFAAGEAASARLGSPQAAAGSEGASSSTMRFHLELPADTTTEQPVQLWARLKSDDGQKLLTHAPIDFRKTTFASVPFSATPSDEPQRPVLVRVVEDQPAGEHSHAAVLPSASDGWTIARPAQPGQLAAKRPEHDGAWRASTQPMPTVIATTAAAKPSVQMPNETPPPLATAAKPANPPSAVVTASHTVAAPRLAAAPWSANRPGRAPAKPPTTGSAPKVSSWSPNR